MEGVSFVKNCEVPDGNIVTVGLKISIALCSSGGMSTTMRCGVAASGERGLAAKNTCAELLGGGVQWVL